MSLKLADKISWCKNYKISLLNVAEQKSLVASDERKYMSKCIFAVGFKSITKGTTAI